MLVEPVVEFAERLLHGSVRVDGILPLLRRWGNGRGGARMGILKPRFWAGCRGLQSLNSPALSRKDKLFRSAGKLENPS